MPYYCTVPRCTSMAGKAKNVSFHQFPRDEELAKLWNSILKRGKPYTKYSKVCSLHFKPEDYTITSVGKNKGQWRTLRKDAIPSQNLPSESPVPYTRQSPGCWVPSSQPTPTLTDPVVQQQMAQAIYMQTMLAMQAAGASESLASGDQPIQMPESTNPSPSGSSLSEIELLLRRHTEHPKDVTYKCHECTKCFKDPDVFMLHKRTHKNDNTNNVEKENYSTNIQDREETLRANPILANLLKTSMRLEPETNMTNILTVENQIMAALASNMEAYIRTLSSMLTSQNRDTDNNEDMEEDEDESKDMCEREADEDDSVDTNKNDEDIQNRFSVEVTASVSRIESPVDENQMFTDDANSPDNTLKEDSYNNKNSNHTKEDTYDCKDIPTNDNQSASNDKSINDNESMEIHEASENNDNIESRNDKICETQNDASVNENHGDDEIVENNDTHESVQENENGLNEDDNVDTVRQKNEELGVENTNLDEKDDEENANKGKVDHAEDTIETNFIRIEIEPET